MGGTRGTGEILTDSSDSRRPGEDLGGPGGERGAGRERQVVLLAGRISCLLGLLLGVGGIVAALFGGTANVSVGARGAGPRILGYFFGSRRLRPLTGLLCV